MMAWWRDKGIDGFRMDVISMLSKEQRFPDGVLKEGKPYGDGLPYYANGPRIHEFLRDMSPKGSSICTTIKSVISGHDFRTGRWDSSTMESGYGTGKALAICWSLRTGIWRPVSMRMTPHFHWNISSRNTQALEPGICGIRLMESEGKMEAGSVLLYTKTTSYKGENRNCRACQPLMWSRMRRRGP